MSYNKNEWKKGDTITSSKLNNVELGIFDISNSVETIKTTADSIKTAVDELNVSVGNNNTAVADVNSKPTELSAAVSNVFNSISDIPSKISSIEDQVRLLKKSNVVAVEDVSGVYNDSTVDAVIANVTIPSGKTSLVAKSIDMTATTAENASVTIAATGDVSMPNVSLTGKLNKTVSNAGVSINTDEYVNIKDCDFSQTGYNTVEIGLTKTAPKYINIENCKL